MFKNAILIISVLVFSLILIACSPQQPETVTSAAKKTLNFRITWDSFSGRGEAIRRIVDTYNASPTRKVNIQLVGGNENRDETRRQIDENGSTTIFVLPYRYIMSYGDAGILHDLSAEFDSVEALFHDEIWGLGEMAQQLYGVPWLGHSICLLYNANLLREANVDPDTIDSLNGFVSALERIEQYTNASGVGLVGARHNDISWMVNQFIYGFGSNLVDPKSGKVTINNDKSAKAIAFYRDTLGSMAQPGWEEHTGLEVMQAFLNQEIAFEFQGVWGLTDVYKNGRPFEVGIIEPAKIGLKSEVGPLMLSISAAMSSEDILLAYDFMHYLISVDAQTALMLGEYSPEHDQYYPFRVPMRRDLHETLISKDYAIYLPFIEGFANPSIDVPIPEWELVKTEFYEIGLHQIMTGQLEIDTFLTEIERIATQLIDERRYGNGD